MDYIYNGIMQRGKTTVNKIDGFHKYNNEWGEQQTQEYILYDSIYIKSKNSQY